MHPTLLAFLLLLGVLIQGDTIAMPQNAPQPLVILQKTGDAYTIDQQTEIFEDESAQLSIREILQRDSLFAPNRHPGLSFGLSAAAVWCRFRVMNNTDKEWYLEIGTPYLHEVTLYQALPGNRFRRVQVSAGWDFTRRPVRINLFVLPLHAPAHAEQTYYLRVRSHFILNFPLRAATLQRIYEENTQSYIITGLYFGLLLALMLYNLFVYVTLKDPAYLHYVVFILANGMYVAYISGFGLAYLYPHQPWLNQSNYWGALAQIFGVLFTHSFLQVKKLVPRLRWLSLVILLLAAAVVVLTLAGNTLTGFRLLLLNVMLVGPYVYIMGIPVLRKGYPSGLYYMLAFTLVNTCVFIYCLQNLTILPHNAFTGNAYMLGSAMEMIVLSYALASKLHTLRKEKMEQATAFARELIATQEGERKRIAAELHDSVGQSLSLIKNRLLLLRAKPPIAPVQMEELTLSVAETLQEVRNISYGLRPVQLDLLGLTKAIENLVEEMATASEIRFYEEIDNIDGLLSREGEMSLYRMVQESLNNMVRHSQAEEGKVLLVKHPRQLVLRIEDNGKGMKNTTAVTGKAGTGLSNIRERLHLLGGTLEVLQGVPYGTILLITVPFTRKS